MKKKRKGKYLQLYEDLMTGKKQLDTGLCKAIKTEVIKKLFIPVDHPIHWFIPPFSEDQKFYHLYWGSESYVSERHGEFTEMRQNVLLFICAIKGQL